MRSPPLSIAAAGHIRTFSTDTGECARSSSSADSPAGCRVDCFRRLLPLLPGRQAGGRDWGNTGCRHEIDRGGRVTQPNGVTDPSSAYEWDGFHNSRPKQTFQPVKKFVALQASKQASATLEGGESFYYSTCEEPSRPLLR